MDSSQYIFTHHNSSLYIGIFLASICLCIAIYQFYRISTGERYLFNRDDTGKQQPRLPVSIFCIIVGAGIFILLSKDYRLYARIRSNRAETIGITIKKSGGYGRGENPTIDYKFIISGKTYYSNSEIYYDGEYLTGIKVPGGHYKVIYNSKNPNESVMDFKANADTVAK